MSSGEEDYTIAFDGTLGSKKRGAQRACDICRRKKIRCDGSHMPGNRCSNCITCNYDCTYVEAAKKRGPPKGYVEGLENRLGKMQKLLSKFCSDGDFPKELGGMKNWLQTMDVSAPMGSRISIGPQSTLNLHTFRTSTMDDGGLALPESDMELDFTDIRFGGSSRNQPGIQSTSDSYFIRYNEVPGALYHEQIMSEPAKKSLIGSTCPEYLNIRPSKEDVDIETFIYEFPEDDLMTELVDLYFRHINIFMPLLHRPTFSKSIADGFHLLNNSFGALVLLICAIASRFSDDRRIFEPDTSEHSAGWKWFSQIRMSQRTMLAKPCLYDLQVYCMSVSFLQGSSSTNACWTMIGVGIRMAQDVGAHRKASYTDTLTLEGELWKRTVWCLVCFDRIFSSNMGRPCAMQDEDFDIDFPLECDDEYLELSERENVCMQPPNKPSKVTFLVTYLKLSQILAFALRTLYAINKAKAALGFVGHEWDQHIVTELDSALNKWFDDVPDHLRWDPSREDYTFSTQSTSIQTSYYEFQILIHRPFISPSKLSPLSFPSLAICTNAARSCIHVVDVQRRKGKVPQAHMLAALFTAGITLLLSIWGSKRAGLAIDGNKEMEDVRKCMAGIKDCEKRWYLAGRLWDILLGLAHAGGLPLSKSPGSGNKRARDSDIPELSCLSTVSSTSTLPPTGPRNIASSKRVSKLINLTPALGLAPQQSNSHPMYDQLPLQGQVHAASSSNRSAITQDDFWSEALGGSMGVPGQSHMPLVPDGYSGLPPTSAFPLDGPFYGQVQNIFPPSSNRGLDEEQGQYSASSQQSHSLAGVESVQEPLQAVNDETFAVWNNVPDGFELDEWGLYVNQLNCNQQQHAEHGP